MSIHTHTYVCVCIDDMDSNRSLVSPNITHEKQEEVCGCQYISIHMCVYVLILFDFTEQSECVFVYICTNSAKVVCVCVYLHAYV